MEKQAITRIEMLAPRMFNLFFSPTHSFTGCFYITFVHAKRSSGCSRCSRPVLSHFSSTFSPTAPHLVRRGSHSLNSFHARLLAWAVFLAAEKKEKAFSVWHFLQGFILKSCEFNPKSQIAIKRTISTVFLPLPVWPSGLLGR